MAENVLFRGAILKHIDVRQGKEGGDVFCRIHMSADYSDQVREKMAWDRIPDSVTECKLFGELLGTHFILTPGDKQLRQHELNFDISSVEDFSVVGVKNDDGKITSRELRFVVRTPKDGVEAFCGQYIRRVGRHAGALKVSYTVQEKLDLADKKTADAKTETEAADAEEGELDTGCILCNNRVPLENEGLHANGQKCTKEAGPSTLASAREAGVGTHQKGRRQRTAPVPEPEPEAAVSDPVH